MIENTSRVIQKRLSIGGIRYAKPFSTNGRLPGQQLVRWVNPASTETAVYRLRRTWLVAIICSP